MRRAAILAAATVGAISVASNAWTGPYLALRGESFTALSMLTRDGWRMISRRRGGETVHQNQRGQTLRACSRTSAPSAAADIFPERRDFLWLVTNGRRGEPPKGVTASRFLPYSGFAAMRSNWTPDAMIDAGWRSTDKKDYAFGIYDQEFGRKRLKPATHRREILFDKVRDEVTIRDAGASADGKGVTRWRSRSAGMIGLVLLGDMSFGK